MVVKKQKPRVVGNERDLNDPVNLEITLVDDEEHLLSNKTFELFLENRRPSKKLYLQDLFYEMNERNDDEDYCTRGKFMFGSCINPLIKVELY